MKKYFVLFLFCISTVCFAQETPPGVIINHFPGNIGKYIGSPSICILPNGDYVASHDEFGPNTTEFRSAVTHIYTSSDKGANWEKISVIQGLFWSNLFVHNNVLYNIGVNKHHGNVVIRKSTDGGKTWTNPYHGKNGLLLEGEYHTAPMPMIVHKGRIWRAIEYATSYTPDWGRRYSAMVISAKVDADLLDAKSWRKSNFLTYDSTYLDRNFRAWIEGNVVVSPEGKILNVLRVDVPRGVGEYAAFVEISKRGKKVSFDPATGFNEFPGGAKKFHIRYDPQSKRYWMIHNIVAPQFREMTPGSVRNTLALSSSTDLLTWQIHKILLSHPDVKLHGFQYINWLFEGDDIIFVSRTAFDDETGGAHSAHDANYLTFHRITDFRTLIEQPSHPLNWSDQKVNDWFDSRVFMNGLQILPDPSIDRRRFAEHYYDHKETWDKAFSFLKNTDFANITVGRIELGGDMYANVMEYLPKDREDALLEVHKKYIDIQYVISGNELMDLAPLENMTITQPYDSDNDAAFGVVAEFTEMKSSPERFFIFFPTDAHRSVLKNGNENMLIRKVVVKVPVESDMEK